MIIRPNIWVVFLHLKLVLLVPINKDGSDRITQNTLSFINENGVVGTERKDRICSEVRSKRQIDESDNEFKPKPSEFAKEDANIESQAFFNPVSNNKDNIGKSDSLSSTSNLKKEHLERIAKPKDENIQIPLYDEDIEINPLNGILDPKYWEDGGDSSSKIMNFFARKPVNNIDSKDNLNSKEEKEKELQIKDAAGVDTSQKENLDEQIREETASCSGNSFDPTHFINRAKNIDKSSKYKDTSKLKIPNRKKFGKKLGKSSTDEEDKEIIETMIEPVEKNNKEYNQINSVIDPSKISSDVVSDLGNVINTLVKGVVSGSLENTREFDNGTIKMKHIEETNKDSNLGDYVDIVDEIDDRNVFSSSYNNKRRLLSFNEEVEQHLDIPFTDRSFKVNDLALEADDYSAFGSLSSFRRRLLSISEEEEEQNVGTHYTNGGDEYDRRNYFAVSSNLDSVNQEQKNKQNGLNFLKNAIQGVRKNNDVEDKMTEYQGNSKGNLFKPSGNLIPKKNLRRQVSYQSPLGPFSYFRKRNPLLVEREPRKAKKTEEIGNDVETTTCLEPTDLSTLPASLSNVSSLDTTRLSKFTDAIGNETTASSMGVAIENVTVNIDVEDEQSNINISNKVVDAIFAQAQLQGDMRNTLGICRKSEDLKTMRGSSKLMENKSDTVVEEIVKCVGGLLKSHAEKQTCLTLDGSLHEFLRWLLLTGESMHGKDYVAPKLDRDRSEFLFPSVCDSPTESSPKPPNEKSANTKL